MIGHWRIAWRIIAASVVALSLPPATGVSAAGPEPAFPATFSLPDGFRPEGITIGRGPVAYLGSLADGSIYRADLRTGRGAIISKGPGTDSAGLKIDERGRLFVAGGPAGTARVVDSRTGRILAAYRLADPPALVNDVLLTRDAAWFTDSVNPVLYRLPLRRDGRLPAAAERLPLTGIEFGPGVNLNGIAPAPGGDELLVVQSNTGLLFRVDPATGTARAVDLGGQTVQFGDGLLLLGRTLYVAQNRANMIAVVRLDAAGTTGRVVERITDPRFDVPTTIARFGSRLYLPNARFGTTPTPTTPYNVVSIPVRRH